MTRSVLRWGALFGALACAFGCEPGNSGKASATGRASVELGEPFAWALRARRPEAVPTASRTEVRSRWRPVRVSPFDGLIAQEARRQGLPRAYVRAVVDVESHFDPSATSRCGAAGLMQLMPATARGLGVRNRYEPSQNVAGGALFLRRLANRFGGSLVLTTAAYNAGPGAVQKYGGVPPYRETRRYVRKVLARYRAYRQLAGGGRT